jgi:hypothetical protein
MQQILSYPMVIAINTTNKAGFPQGIAATSDNSVGVRQPSNCTTVGDRFYGKC